MTTTTENKYVSDGSTVLYSFTFPYINETDVKVSLNDLDITTYTLANATTVELDVAPVSGVSIRIYRSTPTDAISAEFYPGSAIRAQDLNANFEQSLYVVQESQAIIENSDAASVVGIANQALSTANQAKSTADSVSGTANSAVTTANAAETTANAASTNASTAQSTALAAQATANAAQTTADAATTTANAALNSSSVISDLSNVSSTAPATSQVLGWNGSAWEPIDIIQDSPGIAKAWATVQSNGTISGSFNVASVTRVTTGIYDVVFTTAMPTSNYAIPVGLESPTGLGSSAARLKTTSGFQVFTGYVSNSQVLADTGFSFTVHSN